MVELQARSVSSSGSDEQSANYCQLVMMLYVDRATHKRSEGGQVAGDGARYPEAHEVNRGRASAKGKVGRRRQPHRTLFQTQRQVAQTSMRQIAVMRCTVGAKR